MRYRLTSTVLLFGAVTCATVAAAAVPAAAVTTQAAAPARFGARSATTGYIYWMNNGTGTIGRARLHGTGVNQQFIPTTTAGSEGDT